MLQQSNWTTRTIDENTHIITKKICTNTKQIFTQNDAILIHLNTYDFQHKVMK